MSKKNKLVTAMNDDIDVTVIAANIKSAIAKSGLSQKRIAVAYGCTRQNISKLSRDGTLSVTVINKLSAVLGINSHTLLEKNDER